MGFFWRAAAQKSVEALPGIQRRLLSVGERSMAVRFELGKGSAIPAHSHPHDQIGFVASGKLEFTVGGETTVLQAGDGYSIPPNVPHSVGVLEDSVAVDIFSPLREDYLS